MKNFTQYIKESEADGKKALNLHNSRCGAPVTPHRNFDILSRLVRRTAAVQPAWRKENQ